MINWLVLGCITRSDRFMVGPLAGTPGWAGNNQTCETGLCGNTVHAASGRHTSTISSLSFLRGKQENPRVKTAIMV
ncbi:hypothetical protein BN1200_540013 [Klebsiella variicola]|nr:hypothetical protein BN1200_540013 [Klebsiella variicola]